MKQKYEIFLENVEADVQIYEYIIKLYILRDLREHLRFVELNLKVDSNTLDWRTRFCCRKIGLCLVDRTKLSRLFYFSHSCVLCWLGHWLLPGSRNKFVVRSMENIEKTTISKLQRIFMTKMN